MVGETDGDGEADSVGVSGLDESSVWDADGSIVSSGAPEFG